MEVCWPYKENGQTVKIWASGRVVRVADGLTDKKSARAKKILPAGALLWAWDADPQYNEQAGEQWLILLSEKCGISKCKMRAGDMIPVNSTHMAASRSLSAQENRTE